MKIVVYGLTITSSWGNGHATTYRSLLKALAKRGHSIVFIEKDVEWYRSNRDLPRPAFCSVRLYTDWEEDRASVMRCSADADVIIIGSYFPDAIVATEELLQRTQCPLLFYDIDTPITLTALRTKGCAEYLRKDLIPCYAAYLSFTGGPALRELEDRYGAQKAVAFFCSVDPDLYHPVRHRPAFRCDLSYLGTYAPDRQPKLMKMLNDAARRLPDQRFLIAGPLYPEDTLWERNVRRMVHVAPPDHPSFYASSRFTLNLTRDDMVAAGYSPSVRLFEASACGATILSDDWSGLTEFLTPGDQILLPKDARDVASILLEMPEAERSKIGMRARERILSEHTADHRARQFEQIVTTASNPVLHMSNKS